MTGIGLSCGLHLILLAWLALQLRPGNGTAQAEPGITISAVAESDQGLDDRTSDADLDPTPTDLDVPAPTATDLATPTPQGVGLVASTQQASPSLGGAASSAASAAGAGGSGTSFFGISSEGSRFAYIVDRSGSMQRERRWTIAKAELLRSVRGLPEHALFHVVLFSTVDETPPHQRSWLAARSGPISRLRSWLDRIPPEGSTLPMDAFRSVFALPQRPDVIFFLTDGEIPEETAELVRELNRRGRPVVINAIAFGDPASQAMLEQIARESGGRYRYQPTGNP